MSNVTRRKDLEYVDDEMRVVYIYINKEECLRSSLEEKKKIRKQQF